MPSQFLPPEWAHQSGVLLSWPHAHSDWAPLLQEVDQVYIELTREISLREKVLINCHDADHRTHVLNLLGSANINMARIRSYTVPCNDTWTRDYGPITVIQNERLVLLNFGFNGWGGKFDADLDNQVIERMHAANAFPGATLEKVALILEGGSIDVDGEGTLLTTEPCLLAPTRNPDLKRSELERRLVTLLGVSRFLWLKHGHLAGDDTDSHVDTLARFCDSKTIAYVSCDDPQDEHYEELKLMAAELQQFRRRNGEPYHLVALPWPRAKYDADGRRLPASYANFLIINGAVLVPTYDDPADEVTLQRLRPCFPGRELVGVPCLPLIRQNGSLHCVTMQLPAGVL